ncbi:BTB/POZ domain-containing protein 9-like protein [Leptotrombidium deliense]|uniref:BTB/POZ domain-containing protein 9-like protein n=1 Tax=Leptotrombidium deliense TaxID=299467 RepID=A0A443SEL5_9ACAR|nr:BTB/POZ domain-containing protein 9-like protein [Leptotrombidium deliense]
MSKDLCLSSINSVFKKRKHICSSIAVEHKCDINDALVQLMNNEELSDIVFVVDGESVKAHRVILAVRSEYFRALLFGGLKESRQHEIYLKDIDKSTFKLLLKYIYTGTLDSDEVQMSIFDLIYFSDVYCLTKLHQSLIEYIKENLSEEFVLKAYEVAKYYNVKDLQSACFDYIQKFASEVIASECFYETPLNIIIEVLQNDSFFLPEGKIYKAFLRYLQFNKFSREDTKTLIRQVIRFPLLSLDQIVEYLHMDGLFNAEECRKIVEEKCDYYSNYRYVCQKDVNYVTNNENFTVLKGEPVSQIDIASAKILIQDNGFRKKRQASETVFEFSLGKRFLVNHIKTLAYIQPLKREVKKPNSSYEFRETKFSVKQMSLSSIERGHDFKYSYEIYVSPDDKRWTKVTKSLALSYLWQFIYFPPEIVKFLRIVVKDVEDSLVHAMFHLLHLQCFYSTQKFEFDKQMNLIPYFNIAAAPKIPTFYPGVLAEEYYCVASSRTSKEFYTLYSSHKLFEEEEDQETSHNYFLFVLCQDCLIDTIVITLYDKDIREYDFKVECGLHENELQVVDERLNQRSKQVICFQPMVVRFIKIQGTNIHKVDSNEFAILNLEVFKKL